MRLYIVSYGSIWLLSTHFPMHQNRKSFEEKCLKGLFCLMRLVIYIDPWNSCQEFLAEMVHTKDGSRVVREFIAQGTAKVYAFYWKPSRVLTGLYPGSKTSPQSPQTSHRTHVHRWRSPTGLIYCSWCHRVWLFHIRVIVIFWFYPAVIQNLLPSPWFQKWLPQHITFTRNLRVFVLLFISSHRAADDISCQFKLPCLKKLMLSVRGQVKRIQKLA